jgi:DNA repair protein RadB
MPENIQEIKQKIEALKHGVYKEYLKQISEKTVISPVNLEEREKFEKTCLRIRTNTMIDKVIGDGIPEGKSAMLYGEYGSGKTQTVETATCVCSGMVIYIDTEGSFSLERLKEICDNRHTDWKTVRDKIIFFDPENWVEQMLVSQSLPSPDDIARQYGEGKKVDLIICDSISKHFRGIEFLGRESLGIKLGLLREFIFNLERACRLHKAALIYTTQIYDSVEGGGYMTSKADTQRAVGGRSAEHQPDFVLHFRKGSGNIRIVRVMDSSYKPLAEESFVINEKGIDNLPVDSKAGQLYEKNHEKFGKRQKQETLKPDKKKKGESEVGEEEEKESPEEEEQA